MKENLHKELSKYYFLAGGEEIYKDYTTFLKEYASRLMETYEQDEIFPFMPPKEKKN